MQNKEKKQNLLSRLKNIKKKEVENYNWVEKRRESQCIPAGEAWNTWLILAGRGFGKTRTGAETVRYWVSQKVYKRLALIAHTIDEALNVLVDGKSGLRTISPRAERPTFHAKRNLLVWPNGAQANLYGGDYYEKLRGPEFDLVWIDEIAKFKDPEALWNQVSLCLRLGSNPRTIVTTTPRASAFLERLSQDQTTFVTRGTTFENIHNLSPGFVTEMKRRYANTRLGQQELYAQILPYKKEALWNPDLITYRAPPPSLIRIVVAVDPALTHHEKSDETGIIVAGLSEEKEIFILEDFSGKWPLNEWCRRVIHAYKTYKADRIVAEVNMGGDLVEKMLKTFDAHAAYTPVLATRGKYVRAEPVAALYEQKKVFHKKPFSALERQMCEYAPGVVKKSPDRMDALVWGVTHLLLSQANTPQLWS